MDGYEIYGGALDLFGKHKEVTKGLMAIGLAVIIGFIVLLLLIAIMWLFGVGRYDPDTFVNPRLRNARDMLDKTEYNAVTGILPPSKPDIDSIVSDGHGHLAFLGRYD